MSRAKDRGQFRGIHPKKASYRATRNIVFIRKVNYLCPLNSQSADTPICSCSVYQIPKASDTLRISNMEPSNTERERRGMEDHEAKGVNNVLS